MELTALMNIKTPISDPTDDVISPKEAQAIFDEDLVRAFLAKAYALFLYSHRNETPIEISDRLIEIEIQSFDYYSQFIRSRDDFKDIQCSVQEFLRSTAGRGLALGLCFMPIGQNQTRRIKERP